MQSITSSNIIKVNAGSHVQAVDVLAVEEPLEIRMVYSAEGKKAEKNISVTMRTPGNDIELATGFLFTEGIIAAKEQIAEVTAVNENVVTVTLKEGIVPAINKLDRNFYTTSSCGVCGKASIDAVKTYCDGQGDYPYDTLQCPVQLIISLPLMLRDQQAVFEQTGGLHACAIFNTGGQLLLLREDVGRHNALDKLIGAALSGGDLPLSHHVLLLSGRASFELLQKAAMAGIKVIAAVGAPSSLAVQMAEEWNMTLIGFLRGDRFNIYSGAQRIVS